MFAAIACQQFLQMPWQNEFTNRLNNWLHVPLFMLLTALLMWVKPSLDMFRIAAVMAVIAVATEVMQLFTGRQASLSDLGLDAIGCAIALFILRPMTASRLGIAVLLCAAVTFTAPGYVLMGYYYQRISFPMLYQPGDVGANILLEPFANTRIISEHPWSAYEKQAVLKAEWTQKRWPGVHFKEPMGHWQGYQNLVVDVYNLEVTEQPLTAGVRHAKSGGTSRYEQRSLQPGSNQIRFPLSKLAYLADGTPAHIYHLMLYTTEQYAGQQILLGKVWLE